MSAVPSDLQSAWAEACAQFKAGTGFDISSPPGTAALSSEDIVNKFNAKKDKDAKGHQKLNNAKSVVGDTIRMVERIGTVAAQGASMVFGSPATITMSCISFLVDAGFEYKNIAHNIEDLFSRISTIMERFQIYRNNESILDPAMIRVAHRLLIAVVDICRLCITMIQRSKWRKFAEVALFSKDGGIKDQFGLLESLQAEELQMKGTLTLVATEVNKRNIVSGFEEIKVTEAKIVDSISQLSTNSAEDKMLRILKEKLGADHTSSRTEFKAYQDKLTSSTCQWLRDDPQYQSWSDSSGDSNSILILQGDEGCGKSYAITAAVQDLLRRYPQGQQDANRVSVAYYYPNQIIKKEGQNVSAAQSNSATGIIRAFAWQTLNNDLFYRKAVSAVVKQNPDLGNLPETWKKLFLDRIEKESCFFLLLDGMHLLEERGLVRLSAFLNSISNLDANSGRLRILLTSRPPIVRKLLSQTRVDVIVLNLREKTRADVEAYIRDKAATLTIFLKNSPRIQDLNEQVCTGLLDAVDGDFNLANKKLDEIGDSHDPEDVMKIVQRTKEGAGMSDSIVDDIRNCNRTMTNWDIQNLNALLLWIMYGEWEFQIWELDAILYVQSGRESLQPLYNDIKDKFSAFFQTDEVTEERDVTVTLKYGSIADYFKGLSKTRSSPGIAATQTLTKGEIRTVQHFIAKLCEPEMYEKLGLNEFFDMKLSQSSTGVDVDCENAHAIMSLDCLRVLVGELSEEADNLSSYARCHLSDHLKNLDLDVVDPHRKAELGPRLVKAFTKKDAITNFNDNIWMAWTFQDKDDAIADVLRLFHSSAVMKKVAEADTSDQQWVQTILDHETPEIALLEEAAKVKAELWLSATDSGVVLTHFKWLYGWYNKIKHAEDKDVPRILNSYTMPVVEAGEIQEILEMLRNLQSIDVSSPAPLRNIAITYRENGHISDAIEYFGKALAIDEQYLPARVSLALAYAWESKQGPTTDWEPDWEKALEHQEIAITALRAGTRVYEDEDAEVTLGGLFQSKATWLRKLNRHDESRTIYNDLLTKNPDDHELRLQFIYSLCEVQYYGDVVEMLRELGNAVDEDTKQSHISKFFRIHGEDEESHSTIVHAFRQVGRLGDMKNHYQLAINDVKKDKDLAVHWTKYIQSILTYYLAAMLYRHGDSAADQEQAVQLWESNIVEKPESGLILPQLLSARRLAKIYIAKAMEAGRDSAEADAMLAKLRSFAPSAPGDGTDDDDLGSGLSRATVRSLLGRYYSAVGDTERAKEHLRPGVEVGIKFLSDDDPDNDYQAYLKLGDTLMDYGDDENAIAAWRMIQPTSGLAQHRKASTPNLLLSPDPEESSDKHLAATNGATPSSAETSDTDTKKAVKIEDNDLAASSSPPPKPPPLRRANTSNFSRRLVGPLGYQCDGRCGTQWTYADDIYVCRECIDVQFDANCLEKLRLGQIDRDVCDRGHKFMHVPAWDWESSERASENKVLVGDKVIEMDDWIEGLKREWGLQDPATGDDTPAAETAQAVAVEAAA